MTKREEKIRDNNERITTLICLLNNLTEKVPDELKVKEARYDGSMLLENTTEGLERDKFGVEITHSELIPFIEYFEKCKNSEENIVIGIKTYSKGLRESNIENADMAEISVITSDKTILMYLNYLNPITNKISNYVEVKRTLWKEMKPLGFRSEKRKSLINRVIVTAANLCEQSENIKFNTRNDFIDWFIHVDAISPEEITKRIKREGVLDNSGNFKVLELTYDEMKIRVLKMVYNKLNNETLRLSKAGGSEDQTFIEFEMRKSKLSFDMNLIKILAMLEV